MSAHTTKVSRRLRVSSRGHDLTCGPSPLRSLPPKDARRLEMPRARHFLPRPDLSLGESLTG